MKMQPTLRSESYNNVPVPQGFGKQLRRTNIPGTVP